MNHHYKKIWMNVVNTMLSEKKKDTNTCYMISFYKVENYSKLIHGFRNQISIYFWRAQRGSSQEEAWVFPVPLTV